MADDEVIEMGDDGVFELPSPSHKASITPITYSEPSLDVLEKTPSSSSSSSAAILESLSPGEFKCYVSDNVLDIIIKLDLSQGETVRSVEINKDVLSINTSTDSSLNIDLSEVGAVIKAPENGTATQSSSGVLCVRFPL